MHECACLRGPVRKYNEHAACHDGKGGSAIKPQWLCITQLVTLNTTGTADDNAVSDPSSSLSSVQPSPSIVKPMGQQRHRRRVLWNAWCRCGCSERTSCAEPECQMASSDAVLPSGDTRNITPTEPVQASAPCQERQQSLQQLQQVQKCSRSRQKHSCCSTTPAIFAARTAASAQQLQQQVQLQQHQLQLQQRCNCNSRRSIAADCASATAACAVRTVIS